MNQLQALAAQRGAGGAGDPNAAYPDYGDEDAGNIYGADPMAGMMGGAGAGAGQAQARIDPSLATLFNSENFALMAQRMRENPSFYTDFIQRAQ